MKQDRYVVVEYYDSFAELKKQDTTTCINGPNRFFYHDGVNEIVLSGSAFFCILTYSFFNTSQDIKSNLFKFDSYSKSV